MSTAPRRTALDALHRSLGATMTDFAGWDMPLRYASEREEHQAVRTRAGLFDLSHMGEITVSGPQAVALLDYALVGNISTVGPGRARYTMICREDGGILDDLIVYRTGDTEYLVVANAGNAQTVLDALTERSAGFDAEVRDDRDAYALIAVQGPEAPGILKSVTDADLDGLKYYAGLPGTVAGVPALIARTGYTGEDGFELFVAPEHAEGLWRALTEAGADAGLVPCGLSCRDTLRLEAGMPLYGHELTTALTPFDAGLGRVVKFEKEGDFVGRKALEAAAERAAGTPPRTLVGLVAQGRRVPRAGYPVVADGAVIGEVTSGAPSPTLGKPIAMAYVDAAHAAPGTAGVGVDIRGAHEPYEVVALPFYRRQK
ncbi:MULTISPECIES: glycine cleavage system aminomethyltransferase GcvT [Streptomyces]|uniref:Aminomethyltransferase n=1 Tax=Streptomyces tsukubensis (strain DSM 42081 / NBRC 108919 / NRRL 18488 / 9993) TaxID=1114943 RepID=I2N6N3_STRT9|nr:MULTISPECIES: glycine cleavage system aminomethyltransferase GcvT [Streptomyces]AZK96655.1 glycine cleavage system protein T [Streptomyces tsukubensis]EIF92680.1 glycine cleavage system aminomethyltransferase T [Streptomyces tsukubensis NRRL18488]MYS67806.1 glycine cleavage system aminomethyltransferase GcvT [Streptomyces sp. SID5473]QKM67346.1 glycine cleavage system aminomethyltransferase GcvT [Streptomyces tsukubensis NRRL18488]TAI42050.1 glycine cleavage system aminomethyltransferase Gc